MGSAHLAVGAPVGQYDEGIMCRFTIRGEVFRFLADEAQRGEDFAQPSVVIRFSSLEMLAMKVQPPNQPEYVRLVPSERLDLALIHDVSC